MPQYDSVARKVYVNLRNTVNLPKAHKIAVVDREKRTILGTWGTGAAFANYPMALDEANHRLFVVFVPVP